MASESTVREVNQSAHDANAVSSQVLSEDQQDSQTASEFIDSQLQLEADAREALPFSFDRCTRPLGALKQSVFSCITCNPPPDNPSDPYTPAGLCYGCSIACHGEHTLVELFARRNFTCDCGTTRIPETSPCTLRIDTKTGLKGSVHSEEPASGNTYNQNFQNRFCGCGDWYDPHKQKGTMYQCIGLATEKQGGCGEDWWHPECLLGLPHDWHKQAVREELEIGLKSSSGANDAPNGDTEGADDEHPVPPGFPDEDNIDTLICYKCVEAAPWIKKYAGSRGFMTKTFSVATQTPQETAKVTHLETSRIDVMSSVDPVSVAGASQNPSTLKRKAEDDGSEHDSVDSKKAKVEEDSEAESKPLPKHASLSVPPAGKFSILTEDEDFRELFCRCADCYRDLARCPQLLEEEETYEPPVSEDGEPQGSVGTGSLLDRGEAALSNVDRVRAIEGVMAYNHLKDKVKTFLQPFADSGKTVGADDIKEYFAKLRGDHEALKAAGGIAATGGGEDTSGGDSRREQSGY